MPCRTAAATVAAISSAFAGYATSSASPSGSCSLITGEGAPVSGRSLAGGEFDAHPALAEQFAQLGFQARQWGGVVHGRPFGSMAVLVRSR
jgi:hypothetical protein